MATVWEGTYITLQIIVPSGKLTVCYWTLPFSSWIYPSKMVDLSIVTWVYQRVKYTTVPLPLYSLSDLSEGTTGSLGMDQWIHIQKLWDIGMSWPSLGQLWPTKPCQRLLLQHVIFHSNLSRSTGMKEPEKRNQTKVRHRWKLRKCLDVIW